MVLLSGCSIKRLAVNKVGDALAGGGTTFSSDDDPELVKAAIPFSLKLMESLLAESPKHRGLLLASASGFTQYGYAFVQLEADQVEQEDLAKAGEMRTRARHLYQRARRYGLRGLEAGYPGFQTSLKANPRQAVQRVRRKDVGLLYWTAASWGAAVAVSKDDPDLIADLPCVEALMDRALELDEAFDHGAIHSFLITYEMSRQGVQGDPARRSRQHFERAVELTEGQAAAPFVAFAESVAIQQQDLPAFKTLLEKALAVDPDARPEFRLVNILMRQRAKWLLSRTEELFLIPDSPTGADKP